MSKLKKNKVFLKKTRVRFGRTELSFRLSCTEFCALSSGHGPRGLGSYGGLFGRDFCIIGGSKMEKNMKIKDEIDQILVSGALDKCKLLS